MSSTALVAKGNYELRERVIDEGEVVLAIQTYVERPVDPTNPNGPRTLLTRTQGAGGFKYISEPLTSPLQDGDIVTIRQVAIARQPNA